MAFLRGKNAVRQQSLRLGNVITQQIHCDITVTLEDSERAADHLAAGASAASINRSWAGFPSTARVCWSTYALAARHAASFASSRPSGGSPPVLARNSPASMETARIWPGFSPSDSQSSAESTSGGCRTACRSGSLAPGGRPSISQARAAGTSRLRPSPSWLISVSSAATIWRIVRSGQPMPRKLAINRGNSSASSWRQRKSKGRVSGGEKPATGGGLFDRRTAAGFSTGGGTTGGVELTLPARKIPHPAASPAAHQAHFIIEESGDEPRRPSAGKIQLPVRVWGSRSDKRRARQERRCPCRSGCRRRHREPSRG